MDPIAALLLTETIEAERRRIQRHPRRFLNEGRPAPAERRSSLLSFIRIPRFLRLAGRAA